MTINGFPVPTRHSQRRKIDATAAVDNADDALWLQATRGKRARRDVARVDVMHLLKEIDDLRYTGTHESRGAKTMAATLDDGWALFRETDRQFQETDRASRGGEGSVLDLDVSRHHGAMIQSLGLCHLLDANISVALP